MVAVYCRVSSEGQKDNYSIPLQKAKGSEFCVLNEFEYEIFEEVKSAGNTEDRKKWLEIEAGIESGIVTGIWVIHLSRLSRNEGDAARIHKIIVKKGIRLFVDNVEMDNDDINQILIYFINAVFNSHLRRIIAWGSAKGKKEQLSKGLMVYSRIFGYDYKRPQDKNVKVTVNAKESRFVKDLFERYLNSSSLLKTATWANDSGIKPRWAPGKKWARKQIENMICQPVYAGLQRNKGELITSNVYEPIVDLKTWNEAQDLLQGRKQIYQNNRTVYSVNTSISGLIKCLECGMRYYQKFTVVNGQTKSWLYHQNTFGTCKKGITRFYQYVEDIVSIGVHLMYNFRPKVWDAYRHWIGSQQKSANSMTLKKLNVDLVSANKRKENIVSSIANGTITSDDARNHMNLLKKEIMELERKISEIQKSFVTIFSADQVINELTEYLKLEPIEKRGYLKKVTEKMVIKDGFLIITGQINNLFIFPLPRIGKKVHELMSDGVAMYKYVLENCSIIYYDGKSNSLEALNPKEKRDEQYQTIFQQVALPFMFSRFTTEAMALWEKATSEDNDDD